MNQRLVLAIGADGKRRSVGLADIPGLFAEGVETERRRSRPRFRRLLGIWARRRRGWAV